MPRTVGIFENCMDWTETAPMIPCSVLHLRQEHKNMGVPSIRIAGRIYFIKDEVEDWLRKRAYAHRQENPSAQAHP